MSAIDVMSSSDLEVGEIVRLTHKWGGVLGQLLVGGMTPHELAPMFDRSDRTIRRIVDDFEEQGLVCREGAAVELTQFGRQIAMAHCNYLEHVRNAKRSEELLVELPGSATIGCAMMDGAQTETYPDSVPDAAFEGVELSMRGADRVRGFSPTARDKYVEVFSEHIFDRGTEIELVLDVETVNSLDEYYSEEWREAIGQSNCTIWPTESVPEFGLIIVDESEVWLGVYRDGSGLMGAIRNDTPAAVSWAINYWERWRSHAGDPL